MRVVRYRSGSDVCTGLLDGDRVLRLPPSMTTIAASSLGKTAADNAEVAIPLDAVQLLSPIDPPKIVCIGLNYLDHATEQNLALPSEPLVFAKFPTSVTGPYDPILKPADVHQLDYEAELGVVIGRKARKVPAETAMGFIAGYVALNDVSARDFQFTDGQWVRGKSLDTFCPMGPALVSTDEVTNVADLAVRCWVNGQLRQDSNTSNLIFGVGQLISFCSQYFTLEPGDVIATGTPSGVGVFLTPPVFLDPGDVVEVEIGQVGRLRNEVVTA